MDSCVAKGRAKGEKVAKGATHQMLGLERVDERMGMSVCAERVVARKILAGAVCSLL